MNQRNQIPPPSFFSPSVILKNAIEAVPAVKYASGVAGIAAAVALVAGLITNYKIAVFGIILMLGLMTVLVVFSSLAQAAPGDIRILALLLAWAFVILIIATSSFIFTGFFFHWPRPLESYVEPKPTPPPPSSLAIEMTHLNSGQDVAATREANHNSAHFKVPVIVSGETTTRNLGVYILVFDRGIWEIQRDAIVKASKGYYEIDAWSGGGSKEDRTQEGQPVQLRAVVADIEKVLAYAPDGSKQVSEDAREVSPVAISPNPITVKVRPIKQL